MYNEYLLKRLKEYFESDLVSIKISGTNQRFKITDVDDACDIGMIEIVAEPFDNPINYYKETKDLADIIKLNTEHNCSIHPSTVKIGIIDEDVETDSNDEYGDLAKERDYDQRFIKVIFVDRE